MYIKYYVIVLLVAVVQSKIGFNKWHIVATAGPVGLLLYSAFSFMWIRMRSKKVRANHFSVKRLVELAFSYLMISVVMYWFEVTLHNDIPPWIVGIVGLALGYTIFLYLAWLLSR